MLPAVSSLLLAASALALSQQTSEAGAIFADRLTLRAADDACVLLAPTERILLDGLIDRSLDDAIRAGDDREQLNAFEANYSRAPRDCDSPLLQGLVDAHRLQTDALAQTPEIDFPGIHQSWISTRSRNRPIAWPVSQIHSGGQAVFGLVYNDEDALVLTLAMRASEPAAFAVMVVRNPDRQGEPLDFTAGGLLPAPANDPISAWGGAAGAQSRYFAAERLSAEIASLLAPASGETPFGFQFGREALEGLLELSPREGLRIDLMPIDGGPAQSLWFEVGMLKAALAVQGLALPDPYQDFSETETR